jgi:site-specific recombinase XerD
MKALNNFLESRALSHQSKKEYRDVLLGLKSFLEEHNVQKIESFNNDFYESYILDLKSNHYKVTTLNKYISIINNYCFYLHENGYIKDKISKEQFQLSPKKNKKILNPTTFQEIIELIEAHDSENRRNLRIIFLLYKTPLNLKEILALKIEDFREGFQFLTVHGKRIALDQSVVEFLNKEEFDSSTGYLFKNYKGDPLSRQSVWKFINKYNNAFGFDLSIDLLNRSFKVNEMLANYIK